MTDHKLNWNCWIEGEIYHGKITKGQRLINDQGRVVGTFNRDLTEAETSRAATDPDFIDWVN